MLADVPMQHRLARLVMQSPSLRAHVPTLYREQLHMEAFFDIFFAPDLLDIMLALTGALTGWICVFLAFFFYEGRGAQPFDLIQWASQHSSVDVVGRCGRVAALSKLYLSTENPGERRPHGPLAPGGWDRALQGRRVLRASRSNSKSVISAAI
jgi:hypothetical protein